jgi:hypothetical protein
MTIKTVKDAQGNDIKVVEYMRIAPRCVWI